jgi:two-component system cell cycle sensor histidine kinase PleC
MTEVTADMVADRREGDLRIASKSQRLAVKFREARRNLTSSHAGQGDFDLALLQLFANGRRASGPAMAALSGVVAAIATSWVAVDVVLLWLSVNIAALCFTYWLAGKFLDVREKAIDVKSWRRKFIIGETLQGAAWAVIVAFVGRSEDPAAHTCVLILLLLVAAMNSTITAPIPAAVLGALTPMALTIQTFLRSTSVVDGTLPLIAVAFGTQVYFIFLAKKLRATSLETLSFQAEKDELIAELEEAKANSDLARLRAEEANLAKSRFLATMSHELRTPLNAILGFSEVMKGELFGAHIVASYKEYSNDIHSSGQHLLMLINEILDLSRIEAGRFELKEEAVALDQVVEDCRHLLTLRAKKRQITLEEAVEPNLPRIWADERAVRQVTLNLLSNAIKFTPQGGAIKIRIGWTSSGGQYFAVRDSGPGIPEDEIPIVMSSFGRGTLAQKNADEGSGLGLPIVKGLVELHGGTFTLKSKVSEGTEVVVIFPSVRVMDATTRLEPNIRKTRSRPRRESHSAA